MFNSADQVLGALVDAYYNERDVKSTLSCVTDDIEWIGTEDNDSASGKDELRMILEEDVKMFPDSFSVALDPPVVQKIGEDGVMFIVTGKQIAVPGVICGFAIRGTACAVRTEQGWLISHVHTSVPNSAMEKFTLEQELDDKRKQEKTLMNSIPGGIAIYRVKKDGRVATDYVSESLAKMCGYTAPEFLEYLREDSVVNLVQEDIPKVTQAMQEALEKNQPISVTYRIYTKSKDTILIRLDANTISKDSLGDDDLAIFYAVHTIVSDESKLILQKQRQLQELVNNVPTGIGIFEVTPESTSQEYMNDAFYRMIGTYREKRSAYLGANALLAVHPDDLKNIMAAVKQVLSGKQVVTSVHRHKLENGGWFWIRMTCSVVERRENYVKVYGVFSDYNDVIKAQQELETNRVTLQTALHAAKVLTWRYDYKTHRIIDSLTLGEAYNLPKIVDNVPQAIIDMGFIADESVEGYYHMFERLENEDSVIYEMKANILGEGEYCWFRQVYTKTYDSNGEYVDCVGIAIDITEQKRREHNYEEQLRLNKSASKDALSKVYLNLTKNRITSYDHSSPEFHHHRKLHTADELLAMVKYDIKDEEELKKFKVVANCETIIKEYRNGVSHYEMVCHLSDVSKWTRVVYDVLENPYNGDIEMISSIHDVTEQVRSELVVRKLMDIEYKSILLIDNETGVAFPFKRDVEDDNVDELNSGMKETGSQEDGLEAFFRAHCLPEKVEEVIYENSPETIKRELETKPYYECMYALEENGKLCQFRVTYSYLGSDKRILLSAVQDVTSLYEKEMRQKDELALALAEADAANKAKTAFLSRISHDMRTPLNGILGLTTLLKDNIKDTNVISDLNEMEISGKYLLNLINDTLDMSRIESGKLELHPIVSEGRAFFNNALGLAKTSIEGKHIHYHIHAENIPFTILYDDTARMEQVIMNVVSNAVKFTPEGGHIDITVKNISVEDNIITDQIIIKDTGIGMAPEYLPHLFESFTQEDASRTSASQGTGLGMAITKQLLNLMGGDIAVTSELGKGSCFTITLKLHIATEEQIAQWKKSKATLDSGIDLSGKRILLCEDHPLNTKIATRLMESKNMIVEHAENGRIGLEMFSNSIPGYYDAILMDIRMPVMDGIDAAKAIRNLSRRDAHFIPIIAMTANAFKEDMEQTKNAGMDAHLSKPIQIDVFYNTLSEMLKVDGSHRSQKVLIVDDVEINRDILRASLEQDYEILEAHNGAKALEIIKNTRGIDAVITDIQMPKMDGIELIKNIRSDLRYRHIVILANTQFGDAKQQEELLKMGANDFIYKPTSPKIVEARVRNALRRI